MLVCWKLEACLRENSHTSEMENAQVGFKLRQPAKNAVLKGWKYYTPKKSAKHGTERVIFLLNICLTH